MQVNPHHPAAGHQGKHGRGRIPRVGSPGVCLCVCVCVRAQGSVALSEGCHHRSVTGGQLRLCAVEGETAAPLRADTGWTCQGGLTLSSFF
jgi:hypothetical protein